MTVLVTGGTGYVGRFVVERLLGDGRAVRVSGRTAPEEGFFCAPVDFTPAGLEPGQDWGEALAGVTDLVHAAFDHVPGHYRGGEGADADGFRRKNLDGTVALFEAAKRAGVERVAFLSSRAVYGRQPSGTEPDEETEPHPDTLYGMVKLEGERVLEAITGGGFRGVSLRITGVYGLAGPGRRHKWAGLFEDYLAGRPVAPRRGTEVHGADVAAAVLLALDSARGAPVLNVSDGIVDRHDLLAMVQAATGCPHPPPPRSEEPVEAMRCARLGALGWRPGGTALLRQTVRELVMRR